MKNVLDRFEPIDLTFNDQLAALREHEPQVEKKPEQKQTPKEVDGFDYTNSRGYTKPIWWGVDLSRDFRAATSEAGTSDETDNKESCEILTQDQSKEIDGFDYTDSRGYTRPRHIPSFPGGQQLYYSIPREYWSTLKAVRKNGKSLSTYNVTQHKITPPGVTVKNVSERLKELYNWRDHYEARANNAFSRWTETDDYAYKEVLVENYRESVARVKRIIQEIDALKDDTSASHVNTGGPPEKPFAFSSVPQRLEALYKLRDFYGKRMNTAFSLRQKTDCPKNKNVLTESYNKFSDEVNRVSKEIADIKKNVKTQSNSHEM